METPLPSLAPQRALISRREAEVLKLIGEGAKTGEIAAVLGISTKTVESYKDHLKTKLKSDGSRLHVHAIRLGLVRIEVTGELREAYPDLCD